MFSTRRGPVPRPPALDREAMNATRRASGDYSPEDTSLKSPLLKEGGGRKHSLQRSFKLSPAHSPISPLSVQQPLSPLTLGPPSGSSGGNGGEGGGINNQLRQQPQQRK